MMVCEYRRSRSLLDLVPRLCTYKKSNRIFSETTVPIWTLLCMQAFRYKEMKIWRNVAGHMTKMAATPIHVINPSKIFFSGTCGPISTKLGMWHWGLQVIIVCSNDEPGLTLTYFTARSNLVAKDFPFEKVKTVDFSETISACDLKVIRCRQLIEIMKVYEYWRSRSFLYYIFSRFCMFCALLGQDIRWAFTGPLVLWYCIWQRLFFSCGAKLVKLLEKKPSVWNQEMLDSRYIILNTMSRVVRKPVFWVSD